MNETNEMIDRMVRAIEMRANAEGVEPALFFRGKLRSKVIVVSNAGSDRIEHIETHIGAGDIIHIIGALARDVFDELIERTRKRELDEKVAALREKPLPDEPPFAKEE